MTNFKTEIEEIEKRFDEYYERVNPGGDTHMKQCDEPNFHRDLLKDFFRAELHSLLSKFAAEINGEGKDVDLDLFHLYAAGWNTHHSSVAEKAEEIIKNLK